MTGFGRSGVDPDLTATGSTFHPPR